MADVTSVDIGEATSVDTTAENPVLPRAGDREAKKPAKSGAPQLSTPRADIPGSSSTPSMIPTSALPTAPPAPRIPPVVPPAPVSDPPPARLGSGAPAPIADAVVRPATGPRRARLLVTRIDPWSVMKTAFVLALAGAIILSVAVALLWWVLDFSGVFAAINRTVDDLSGGATTTVDVTRLVGFSRVMGATLTVSAVEIVLISVLATLFAFLYNLAVGFTSGIEVTLTEDR